MQRLFDDIQAAYQSGIEAPGKELHFLVLVAFVCSFGFIRTSAHLIRSEVSWWPGNVETTGGTHIHHLVWGILLLMGAGYVGVAVEPASPWREITALLFGIGLGLTLDEFALWLNLEDVYWSAKGRQSIDAVIVTVSLLALTLLGLDFWLDVLHALLVTTGVDRDAHAAVLIPLQLLGALAAVFCLLKGRMLTGLVGLFLPLVAFAGAGLAIRAARSKA